jgi:hypothetical protein
VQGRTSRFMIPTPSNALWRTSFTILDADVFEPKHFVERQHGSPSLAVLDFDDRLVLFARTLMPEFVHYDFDH